MNQDPILQKAMDKWENMSHDSSFRSAYEAREKLLLDEQAKLAHAREEGLEEGKIQLIRSMYENGMPLDDIAKFTGLSIEEVGRVIR
jgi:predicted transposase/invertase (TIGR01784 family)